MHAVSIPRSTCAVLTVLVLGLLTACDRSVPVPPQAPGPSISGHTVRFSGRVDGIRTETVRPAGSPALTLPGRLTWDDDRTVRVMAPLGGRVVRPLVRLGDTVRAGQPLAEIVSGEYGSALADARVADSEVRLAEETLRRQTELFESGLVARRDLLQAQADREARLIERARTQTRLKQFGAGVGEGPNFLLRAPIAGVVVDRHIQPGQELRTDGSGAPLFVLTDPGRLWVRIDVTESDLASLAGIKAGAPLSLSSVAYPGRRFEGSLTLLGAAVDTESRTIALRGTVPNAEGLLKGEMYVSVTFPLALNQSDAPLHDVPATAVLMNGGEHHVFVLDDDGGFTRVKVRVKRVDAGRSLIQGLADGQKVVVEGSQFLDQILAASRVGSGQAGADRGHP